MWILQCQICVRSSCKRPQFAAGGCLQQHLEQARSIQGGCLCMEGCSESAATERIIWLKEELFNRSMACVPSAQRQLRLYHISSLNVHSCVRFGSSSSVGWALPYIILVRSTSISSTSYSQVAGSKRIFGSAGGLVLCHVGDLDQQKWTHI